jgi:hypothetical protein
MIVAVSRQGFEKPSPWVLDDSTSHLWDSMDWFKGQMNSETQ